AVPEGQREAESLVVVRDAGQAVLAPAVGARAGVIVREIFPGRAPGTVIFAYGAPLPLGQVRAPAPPVRNPAGRFRDASMLLGHARVRGILAEFRRIQVLHYAMSRLLWLVPTLLAMALVTFLVMHATPGSPLDPVAEGANPLSPEAQKVLAKHYGLDRPLYEQFAIFVSKAVRGDFGYSFVYKTRTVQEIIAETFPISLLLGSMALVLAPMGIIARFTRASMLEVIRADYTLTARAKGLGEIPVIFKHALKNAFIPVVTLLGPMFAAVGTGSFFVEAIFRVPGMGRFFVLSMTGRDYPMIMAVVLTYGVFLAIMNLVVDLLYGVLDPRIRY